MDRDTIRKMAELSEELSGYVVELEEQQRNLVEFNKEEALKQVVLKSLLIDKGIITDQEFEERYNLFKEELRNRI